MIDKGAAQALNRDPGTANAPKSQTVILWWNRQKKRGPTGRPEGELIKKRRFPQRASIMLVVGKTPKPKMPKSASKVFDGNFLKGTAYQVLRCWRPDDTDSGYGANKNRR